MSELEQKKYILILENPLLFMNETYLRKVVLKEKYSSVNLDFSLVNGVIEKIYFLFSSESLLSEFLSEFYHSFSEDKPKFDETLKYKPNLTKCPNNQTLSELKQAQISENSAKILQPQKFQRNYEIEWRDNYMNSPDKPGLVYLPEDEKEKGYRAVKYLITKFGKNLLEGRSVLNISLPVFIFDKRTIHQAMAYDFIQLPYFIEKAIYTKGIFERLKIMTSWLISCLHLAVIQVKPFNPIIGETYQCKIGNMNFYVEHTVNHPITANFYGISDNKEFTIFGYFIYDASLSPNSVKAARLGKFFIKFSEDGTLYQVRIPDVEVRGTAVGDRMVCYIDKGLVIDETNKICSFIEFNPEEGGGGIFGSLFGNKKKHFADYFRGKFVEKKFVKISENSGKHEILPGVQEIKKFEGEWTSYLKFEEDENEIWKIEDYKSFDILNQKFVLDSDGTKRGDLVNLIQGNEEQSQIEKERLEELQRKDRKLRKKYLEKKNE